MTAWTDVLDEYLAPGRGARSVDIKAIRDNILAQAEGAAGAPKNQLASMAASSVGTTQLVDSSVTTAKLANSNVTRAKINFNLITLTGTASSGATVNFSIDPYSLMWRLNYTTTAGQTGTLVWGDDNLISLKVGTAGTNLNYTITYMRID